ncbi:MAG: hypothetical protein EOP48_16560 [Sphingobacteriales bacterium]|nr:MAG: hypothetical protein EOP48_16560 [Sphingobacteriales bacterium]
MQTRFSKIVLENEGIPNEVSSASFKIADDKVKFTLNSAIISKDGRSIVSFGIASDIASNSSIIYSKGKLNTAFSMNARASFLTKPKLYYSCTNKDKLIPEREKVLNYARQFLLNDSIKKKYADAYLVGVTSNQNSALEKAPTGTFDETATKNIKAMGEEIDKWTKYIAEHLGAKKLFDNILDSLYGIETKSEPWNAIKLEWFSVYGSISPTKYNVYFENPDSLIADTAFNGYRAGIDYNWMFDYTDNLYTNKPSGINSFFRLFKVYTRYHSLRFDVSRTNNVLLFDTAQVVNKDGSKVKAVKYVADSTYRTLYEYSFSFKNLLYFGSNRYWGIELTPRYTFRNETFLNNSLDLDAGLLFQLKDRDKEKSKVNFEFLFSFYDLTNRYKYTYPIKRDRFKISFIAGIPLSSVFRGLF